MAGETRVPSRYTSISAFSTSVVAGMTWRRRVFGSRLLFARFTAKTGGRLMSGATPRVAVLTPLRVVVFPFRNSRWVDSRMSPARAIREPMPVIVPATNGWRGSARLMSVATPRVPSGARLPRSPETMAVVPLIRMSPTAWSSFTQARTWNARGSVTSTTATPFVEPPIVARPPTRARSRFAIWVMAMAVPQERLPPAPSSFPWYTFSPLSGFTITSATAGLEPVARTSRAPVPSRTRWPTLRSFRLSRTGESGGSLVMGIAWTTA